MARVPEDELERLKAQVSVQRLAEARGVELKRHGAAGWCAAGWCQSFLEGLPC